MSDLPQGAAPGHAHDRSIEDFDELYSGTPPWDIGRPQPVFVALADAGRIAGRVLDAGCGTGEHTLMLAARGIEAVGVDAAPTAIALAQEKAVERGVSARFLVGDALRLGELDEQFDMVLDSALFHVFDDERRKQYVHALARVLPPNGQCVLCCFSDAEPGDWGPRRVAQDDLRSAFSDGWTIESIEPTRFETNVGSGVAQAWLMFAARI